MTSICVSSLNVFIQTYTFKYRTVAHAMDSKKEGLLHITLRSAILKALLIDGSF
jgi:hypothetical protein